MASLGSTQVTSAAGAWGTGPLNGGLSRRSGASSPSSAPSSGWVKAGPTPPAGAETPPAGGPPRGAAAPAPAGVDEPRPGGNPDEQRANLPGPVPAAGAHAAHDHVQEPPVLYLQPGGGPAPRLVGRVAVFDPDALQALADADREYGVP